ncbi:MAG TPA: hypothetical protein VK133_03910 [Amoebophilaceae bacterium]|nr:hypothetical protein [Amoebophilaceae bacterium]
MLQTQHIHPMANLKIRELILYMGICTAEVVHEPILCLEGLLV